MTDIASNPISAQPPINELDYLRIGWLHVHQVSQWKPNEQLTQWARDIATASSLAEHLTKQESLREGVRALLRKGGYKPSGRNKPAQEYLQRCIREGDGLPVILPAVDVLNATSVQIGLPISMLGTRYFPSGMRVRIGIANESFVFNSTGQTLEVEGLIVVCGGDRAEQPLGSPVKDSMAGKISPDDEALSCLIYAPASMVTVGEMTGMAESLAQNLEKWAGAKRISLGTA